MTSQNDKPKRWRMRWLYLISAISVVLMGTAAVLFHYDAYPRFALAMFLTGSAGSVYSELAYRRN